mmetsp:Transcript_2343/g.4750  ORF Transcript_2343/g.4750 Transcript_2343/m.4750 type:complete len:1250 (-) Transcript_2343:91-3840(-)
MEPNRPATSKTSDEDAKARPRAPATKPGAVQVAEEDDTNQSTSTTTTSNNSNTRTVASIADEKGAYRSSPSSRPGVQSVNSNNDNNKDESVTVAPTITSHSSDANEPSTVATTTAAGSVAVRDEKAAYRSAPASRPGAASVTSGGGGSSVNSNNMRDEKAAYRSNSPASRPGVAAASGASSVASGGSSVTSSMRDEKAAYRSSSASRLGQPGVVAAAEVSAGSSSVSSSMRDEKAAYRSSSRSVRPGAASMSGSIRSTTSSNSNNSSSMQDEKAMYRSTRTAMTPGAIQEHHSDGDSDEHTDSDDDEEEHKTHNEGRSLSLADASATVGSVEADLMAKRQASQRASRPGAVSSTTTTDDAASRKSRSGGAAAAAGLAVGGTAAGLAIAGAVNNNNAATNAAVVAAVEQDLIAKQGAAAGAVPATTPGVVGAGQSGDAAVIVGSVEHDLMTKRASTGPTATGPGAVSADAAVVAAIEQDLLSKEMSIKQSSQPSMKAPSSTTMMVEPKSSMDMMPEQEKSKEIAEFPEDEENEEGLAIARPVKDEPVVLATDFDPSGGKPFYQKNGFLIILGSICCLLLSAVVVGVSVAVTRDDDDKDIVFTDFPTFSPTAAPTLDAQVALRYYLENEQNVTQRHIEYSPISYEMAVRWYANDDPGFDRSGPLEEWQWSLQRFVMVWLYFHGTANGTKSWVSCNPPAPGSGQDEDCIWLKFNRFEDDVDTGDRALLYFEEPAKRWLSAAHECDWAGNICLSETVRSITPDKFQFCIGTLSATELMGVGFTGTWPLMLNLLRCTIGISNMYNPDLVGSIPDDFWTFSLDPGDPNEFGILNQIIIAGNTGMTGTMPDTVFDMQNVVRYTIRDTPFSGHGDEYWRWFNLQLLALSGLDFVEEIPTNFSDIRLQGGLKHLEITNNKNLAGSEIPPEIGELVNLTTLRLEANGLVGPLPDSFAGLTEIETFNVAQNSLNGTLPQDLPWVNCDRFEVNNNLFSGELPTTLPTWTKMRLFLVADNQLSGEIDPALGTVWCPTLQRFALRNNHFSGVIPDTFQSCIAMESFFVNLNNFTGEFPFEICQLRSKEGLMFIHADCLDYPPQVTCQCCTTCCNAFTENCQTGDVEIENRRLRGSTDQPLETEKELASVHHQEESLNEFPEDSLLDILRAGPFSILEEETSTQVIDDYPKEEQESFRALSGQDLMAQFLTGASSVFDEQSLPTSENAGFPVHDVQALFGGAEYQELQQQLLEVQRRYSGIEDV